MDYNINEEKEKRRLQLVAYYRGLLRTVVKENHREYLQAMLDSFENNTPVPCVDIYGRLSTEKRPMLRFAHSTPVYCEETDKTYNSIRTCAKELGIDAATVVRWIQKPENAKYRLYKVDAELKEKIDATI